MIKRVLSYFFVLAASIGFVSAQYYGRFSIGDILNQADPSTMVLGLIFVISVVVVRTALSRAGPFKDNNAAASVISLALSLLFIWSINRSGWNYYYFFNGVLFFIPTGYLEVMWPIGFLLIVLFTAIKWKWNSLYLIGGLLFAVGLIMNGGAVVAVVGFFMVIGRGIYVAFIKKKPKPLYIKSV